MDNNINQTFLPRRLPQFVFNYITNQYFLYNEFIKESHLKINIVF